MALPTASDNLFPKVIIRESANDGSDFSNPVADYRALFLGEDGFLHTKDSAGSVSDPYPAGAAGPYDIERRTAGDLAITSTTDGAAVGTIGDLVVAAAAGDLLLIGLSTRVGDSDSQSLRLDVGTIVSAAVVNYVSSLSGTAASTGIPAWFCAASVFTSVGPSLVYVVQAGDISGGNVTLSLRAWLSGAGSRPLTASTSAPLDFWVKNLGQ